MFEAGASGYLLKDAVSSELILAIHTVMANQVYVSPAVAASVIERVRAAANKSVLNTREREVVQLIAEGKGSKEIGAMLHMALSTVETNRRQIMAKLGVHSIAELTKYALREGLTLLER
jgi:DNA-binding NarL/FixJ family response regulator